MLGCRVDARVFSADEAGPAVVSIRGLGGRRGGEGRSRRALVDAGRGAGSGASLLSDLGHEIPTSLLPSFLTSTLGAPAAALGLIEGVADGLAGAARFAGGALADDPTPAPRRRRRLYRHRRPLVADRPDHGRLAGRRPASRRWAARGLRGPSRNALLADAVPAARTDVPTASSARWTTSARSAGRFSHSRSSRSSASAAILLVGHPGPPRRSRDRARHPPAPTLTVRERRPLSIQVRPVLHGGSAGSSSGIGAFEFGNVAATLLILRATQLLEPGAQS